MEAPASLLVPAARAAPLCDPERQLPLVIGAPAWLSVEGPPVDPYPLTLAITRIGRADPVSVWLPDVDLSNDTGVSRRHLEIRRVGGGFEIVDLHSKNGTFLNGERLLPEEAHELQPGDRVRLGNETVLTF